MTKAEHIESVLRVALGELKANPAAHDLDKSLEAGLQFSRAVITIGDPLPAAKFAARYNQLLGKVTAFNAQSRVTIPTLESIQAAIAGLDD